MDMIFGVLLETFIYMELIELNESFLECLEELFGSCSF